MADKFIKVARPTPEGVDPYNMKELGELITDLDIMHSPWQGGFSMTRKEGVTDYDVEQYHKRHGSDRNRGPYPFPLPLS